MEQPLYKLFAEAIRGLREDDLETIRAPMLQLASRDLVGASNELFRLISSRVESRYGSNGIVSGHALAEIEDPEQSLSEIEQKPTLPGTSIVSCCMNRNENLRCAIETWLETSADEIVIVDWSSSTPVRETISDITDPRIRIIEVGGESHWILTVAFNVGLRFASRTKIFKLDADITVKPDFIERNDFSSGEFVCGSWRIAQEKGRDDQVYINGSFGAFKEDLQAIGFYNEDLRHYGWDDSDLYERLASRRRLREKHLDIDSVHHMDQCETQRTTHQEVVEGRFLGQVEASSFLITTNRYQARIFRGWDARLLQDFRLERQRDWMWKGHRTTVLPEIPGHVIDDARHYAALEHATICVPKVISSRKNAKETACFLYEDYEAQYPSAETLCLLGESDYFDRVWICNDQQALEAALEKVRSTDQKQHVAIVVKSRTNDHERVPVTAGQSSTTVRLEPPCRFTILCEGLNAPGNTRFGLIPSSDASRPGMTRAAFREVLGDGCTNPSSVESERRRIYIDCQHGLGNRLRAAASAAAVAEANDRELVVVWEPDEHCDCRLSDLFEYNGPVLESAMIDAMDPARTDLYNYIEVEPGGQKNEPIVIGEKDIYVRSAYVLNCEQSSWNSENDFLRRLKPAAGVVRFLPDFEPGMCIGVHIRSEGAHGSQERPYDALHNYSEEGYESIKYWRSQCHYSKFLDPIRSILEEEPDLNIFLAADLPETYDAMRSLFGARLLYIDRPVFDRSREQLQYAMADIIVLSRCKYLLGSHWSSFSELAHRLSRAESKPKFCGLDF